MMKLESEFKVRECNISHLELDSSDLSSDGIYSESSESEDMSSARMRVEEKTVCPAPPHFHFTENAEIKKIFY